jgi:uncharacterized protein (DUF927 family)
MKWPTRKEEFTALANALSQLIGGRKDIAARYFEFSNGEKIVKGWGPWKGRRVPQDYQPPDGEIVAEFKDPKSKGIERRVLKPLSVDNLVLHLRGKERLGVYVLDKNENVSFIAADFDDHNGTLDPASVWQEVKQFSDTCETNNWLCHVEKSKSGKGYHVWLFFDAPIPASKARAIGRWLFEESQTLRSEDDFSTFDRFFPAQAKLPPHGKSYGNLIGLPLSGFNDYQAGRCAWVDRDGQVIDDPYQYTLDIVKLGRNSAARVDAFMEEWKLEPDETGSAPAAPRDPNTQLGTAQEFEAVVSRCKFLQWAAHVSNQPNVSEPLWFGMISNACRFDVDNWIHDASSAYKGYSSQETQNKIDHARTSAGPHKCKTIQDNGFTQCPPGGCKLPNKQAAAAPAGLAAWARPRESKTPDRSVGIAAAEIRDAKPGTAAHDAISKIDPHPETGAPWPPLLGKWEMSGFGVIDKNDEHITLRPIWINAITQNSLGMMGVSVKFFDQKWGFRTAAFPLRRLHEQGGVLASELADEGMLTVPGKEKWLARFLSMQASICNNYIRAATRLGWYDAPESPAVFVLPHQVIGKAKEDIVYQPDTTLHTADPLHGQGKLADWQNHIAQQVNGNPVLMFTLMVGLAGPLLKLCQEQSGGFHIYGVTTGGKTTAAQVAASVWGCAADPQEGPEITSIRKWYTTGNALESIAEVHNDMVLALDEIGEVDPNELGRIIYQLAGGLSKGRANASGGLRAMKTWRLLFVSTGEKSVRQMLAQVGQNQKGGQRVRLPDIPADDNESGERSIVINTHGEPVERFVQDLKLSCARYYGTAGPALIGMLVHEAQSKGLTRLAGELREELKKMEEIMLIDPATKKQIDLPPEGKRVLRRFALVAVAGARAVQYQVINWELNHIIRAVLHVRDRWLSEQGQERSEIERSLSHLRDELIKNSARFRPLDAQDSGKYRDLLGFRADDYFLLHHEGMQELCGEYDTRTILLQLKTRGFLWHDKDRLTRKSPKLEGYGNRRLNLYWIALEFLGARDDTDTAEDVEAGVAKQQGWNLGSVSRETGPRTPLGPDDPIPF